ncbi:MAG: tetratricopeptide repeat protein [Deferrisomatales bacterium]|nr:tetratricopeptide repeat protein [Deferrisomatales bacterium]
MGKDRVRPRGAFAWALALPLLLAAGCATGGKQAPAGPLPPRPPLAEGAVHPRSADLPVDVLVESGRASAAQGNYGVAEFYFSTALAKEPGMEPALSGLGEVLRVQGRTDEARGAFARAAEVAPDSVPARIGLGRVHRAQSRHDESLRHLRRAVELSPEDPVILEELALTYEAAGQEAFAEPLFRLAAEKTDSARAWNNLGFNYLRQKRYADAVAPLERAVALDGSDPVARNNLALAYGMTGREDRALSLFEGTVGKAAAQNNMGYLYTLQGRWADAEAAFNRAMEINPAYYVRAKENLDRLGQLIVEQARENLEALQKEGGGGR